MANNRKFYIQRSVQHRNGALIYMETGKGHIIEPIVMTVTKDPESGMWHPPTMELSEGEAQGLIDALWQAGYRPNNGESSLQHIEALKHHLEDMRKLAFRKK